MKSSVLFLGVANVLLASGGVLFRWSVPCGWAIWFLGLGFVILAIRRAQRES